MRSNVIVGRGCKPRPVAPVPEKPFVALYVRDKSNDPKPTIIKVDPNASKRLRESLIQKGLIKPTVRPQRPVPAPVPGDFDYPTVGDEMEVRGKVA